MAYEIKLLTSAKVPEAPIGFNAIRLGWKGTKAKDGKPARPALGPNRYVHIPAIQPQQLGLDVSEGYDKAGTQLVMELFYEAQAKFIHTLVSEQLENKTFTGVLTDDQISLEAMVLDSQQTNRGQGKLTKEMVQNWFVENMFDDLFLVIKKSLGFEGDMTVDQKLVVENKLAIYMEQYGKLAGPSFRHSVPMAKKLLDVLVACGGDKEERVYRSLEKKLLDQSVEQTPESVGI